jgi:hypothetical protein
MKYSLLFIFLPLLSFGQRKSERIYDSTYIQVVSDFGMRPRAGTRICAFDKYTNDSTTCINADQHGVLVLPDILLKDTSKYFGISIPRHPTLFISGDSLSKSSYLKLRAPGSHCELPIFSYRENDLLPDPINRDCLIGLILDQKEHNIAVNITLYYLPTDSIKLTLARLTVLSNYFGEYCQTPGAFTYSIKPDTEGYLSNYGRAYLGIEANFKSVK